VNLPAAIAHTLADLKPTRPLLALLALQLAVVLAMMIWERRRPAHAIDHRRVWKRDAMAFLVYNLGVAPGAILIGHYISYVPILPQAVYRIPFAVRVVMFVIIGDFGYYWVHRAMHTRWLWSLHRWHHSPGHMYWLVGVRGSLLQQILVNIPYLFAQALFAVSPWWTGLAIIFKNSFMTYWMHMNVRWGPRWLEWLLVTPRYHHIHHSDNPAYYGSNVAALLPVWDRLFGTYVDPDTVARDMAFGTNEKAAAWRLAVGV